jgi:hypothetical protein
MVCNQILIVIITMSTISIIIMVMNSTSVSRINIYNGASNVLEIFVPSLISWKIQSTVLVVTVKQYVLQISRKRESQNCNLRRFRKITQNVP